MSALSDYIKARRESQFGTTQDMENYITASNGSWYHGNNTGSSAIENLANVFGGSALASIGDFITGVGTLNKDMAGNDELDYLNPLRQSLYGEDNTNELNRIRALGREATAERTIKAGQKLSDYGSDMVADHTRQGKAPDGKTWDEMDFTDRVLNSDYWTDPYGIGNDLAVMGGSFAGQAPLMAAIPGGAIAGGVRMAAKGLLGGLGKLAASKAFAPGMEKAIGYAGSRGMYKAGEKLGGLGGKLGESEALGSMANWAARSAPITALTNAGGIYSDLKEQGYSDSEIAQTMRNMMVDEIPQDFVTGAMTGLALSGKLGRVGLGKAGKKASRLRQGVQNFAINAPLDVTSEYFDEANQQRLQNKYTNKAYGEDIFHLTDDERAAGATAAAPALIPGLAGGARNTVLRGRSLKEAYNDYRKARSAKAVSNTIADTNREITNSVANANAWLDDDGNTGVTNAPTTQTAPTAPTGGEAINAVSAAEPFMGQRMDNGENGCVEAVTKIGANGGNEFLANELKNGVVGVPKLVEDAGDKVVPFDENNVSEGDLIVYGDNDHVVMADGKGGYVGNSSSQQKVVQGDNYMDMGGLKPTKIIKTGGMSAPVANDNTNNATGSYSGNADIDSMIDSAAQKYNVPPALLAALAEQESGFDVNAKSGAGAIGMMQLMPETAESLGVDPNDVASNIEGGAKYLRQMLDAYDGDVEKALAAYNAGPGAMEEVGNDISKLSEETRNYVPSVMEKYRKFGGGESVNTGNNTDTEWNINADDVFGDVDNDFVDTVIDDFVGTAANDDTYAFPGLENLLNHAAEDGYVHRKELANEGLEQFEQYLTDLLNTSDTDIARIAEQVATNRKDGHALNLITGALNSNNTSVIKQIADSYRKPIIRLLNNIGKVRKNAEQVENVGDSVPAKQDTTGVPKQQNEGSLADRIAEQQKQARNTNVNVSTPNYLINRDGNRNSNDGRAKKILRDIHDKSISDIQAQPMAAQAQISQEQALAMAKASEEKNRRIAQAQALKSMAQANNVEIPKAVQPGLEAGAKKAIETVQALVAPTLETVKGGNVNETQTTNTEKTTPEEGIDTENKVQHTESEQGNEKAEVAVDNKEIETGTHVHTKTGETKYKAVIRKRIDGKRLKALARKHHGGYSTFAKGYLFSKESDRDGFVADVNAEFFGKDTQADTAQNMSSREWIESHRFVYDNSKSVDENISIAEGLAKEYISRYGTTDNIHTPEREQLRKDIVNEIYGKGAKKKEGRVWLILGVPASGKSTFADPIVEQEGALLIDSDEAKAKLPEFANGLLATAVHEESSQISKQVMKQAIHNHDNMVIPVVGKTLESLQEKIDRFKENGYEVNLIYVDLPVEKAIDRVKTRFQETGRLVSPSYLQSVGLKPKENYDKLKSTKEVDSYEAWSNDVKRGNRPVHIETSGEDKGDSSGMGGRRHTGLHLEPDVRGTSFRETTESKPLNRSDNQDGFSIPKNDGNGNKQGKPLPKGGAGNTVEAVTDDGKTVNVRYHIVNVDKVIASNIPTSFFVNKKYPAELQPRNRQRAAMQTQVENMANNLRAEDLTVGRNLNQGAPIVRRDGVVLNGNGRALAIMTAYENGRADSYKEYILSHAAEFGLSDKDIANIRKADSKIMLVREVMDDMDGATVTAITESTVGGSRLGAAEQAQADAKKITSGVLDEYVPNENNDITNTANRNFVGGILSKIINNNDSNAYTDNTGNVNKDGLERVKRALCALAYGDSNVIDKMVESTDDNIANVSKALVQAAPLMAQVKLMIDKGVYQPYAISRCISEAVNHLQWIKDTGDMTVDEYLNQTGLFGEDADSEETKEIIRAFNDYRRSAKRMAAFLNKVASLIKAQSKTDEMSFDFGGMEQPMSLYEILTTARQYVDSGEYKTGMTDHFADNSGADNKKTTSEGGNAESVRKSLIDMATRAWNDNNVHERVSFAPSDKLKAKVKELFGHDIDEVFITSDDVRHIKKHHSENEENRGQVSLRAKDMADIYDTVNDFDSATLEEADKKGNKKMLTVRSKDGKMYSLLIERGARKVEVKTAYKQKNKAVMFDVTSPKPNVRNDSQLSTSNVTENSDKGKKNADDGFHGFLDDKPPGAVREIKNTLTGGRKVGGNYQRISYKYLIESYAGDGVSKGRRGNFYTVNGGTVPKAAYLYFEYLESIGYKGINAQTKEHKEAIKDIFAQVAKGEITLAEAEEAINKDKEMFKGWTDRNITPERSDWDCNQVRNRIEDALKIYESALKALKVIRDGDRLSPFSPYYQYFKEYRDNLSKAKKTAKTTGNDDVTKNTAGDKQDSDRNSESDNMPELRHRPTYWSKRFNQLGCAYVMVGKWTKAQIKAAKEIAKQHDLHYDEDDKAFFTIYGESSNRLYVGLSMFFDEVNESVLGKDNDNKKTTSEGGVTLADGYRTESGKPLNEADRDEFIVMPNGSKDFGEISEEISEAIEKQSGEKLKVGKIRLRVGDSSQGLIHAKKHEQQAKEAGYDSVEDMIADVANNFDSIYMRDSKNPQNEQTYSLVKHGNKQIGDMNSVAPVYFDLVDDGKGQYYIVITAMPKGDKSLKRQTKKDRLIYSSPGLDTTTTSNSSAVSRPVSNNVGAEQDVLPTSDKSNGLVTTNVTENGGESKIASTNEESHQDGEANTVKATYSDKNGSMKGCIANGVITVWEKPGGIPKKEKSFTVTLEEMDNALKNGGANSAYTIRQLAKEKERAATEAWIEGSKTESLRDKRRDHWENDTLHGNFSAQEERIIDSVAKVIENLYEQATGQKPMRWYEKRAEEKKKAKENSSEISQDNADVNNSIFGDVDENDIDELIKSMGFTPVKGDEKTVVAPEGISNAAEERERLEKALMAELNKLSVNPVFNPKIYTLGLQLGFTYVKDGYNTAKKWLAKMHITFGDKIEPWAAAIWNTIESYPSEIPFNEQTVSIATRIVGSMYEKGNTDLEQITNAITQKMTADQKKVFVPITEAAYNGVRIFFDNMKEAENNGGKQRKSGGTSGGREGVQAGTSETSEEGGNRPVGVSGEVSGQGGRERTGNSESADGENTRGTKSSREGTGREQSKNDGVGDSERGRKQPSEVSPAKTVIQNQPAGNYEIKKAAEGKTSKDERFKQNIKAITLLKKLESEDRMPTAAEQKVLAAYNGWGGLKSAFIDKKMNNELREVLTEEEYESALKTINDAFYTSPDIIRAIWKGVSRLGFKGGRVLDPSMGIGNFFGCMPRDMMGNSTLHGIEIDDLTTRFAKKLYPNANIEHKGFQDSKAPNGYYDLVISNVPFSPKEKIQGYLLHNYFFANGIDKVRPGGLMVFITSQGSLTNGSDGAKMRSYLAERADMVAAFKLPGGAFKEAGTDVVTDIVIMRKRDEDGKPSPHAQNFISVGEYKEDGFRGQGVKLNDYFKEHPEHVLGEIYRESTQYGYSAGVKPADGVTAGKALSKAVNSLPKDIYAPADRKDSETFDTVKTVNTISNEEGTRMFEYYEKDGKLYQNVGEHSEEVTGVKKVGRIRGILKIKSAMNELIAAQYNPDLSEKEINKLRDRLNKVYDTYVKKNGYLHGTESRKAFEEDPSSGMILALERPTYVKKQSVDKNGKKSTRRVLVNAEKADIFSKRIIAPIKEVTKAETPEDALLFSLSNTGRVDLGYMAKLLNSNPSDVAESLKGKIYKNPATGTYETVDEYLSGNVRQKLAVAELEAANNDEYRENVEALKKVMPEDLVPSEILVNIGSPWIPETDIQEYVDRIAGNENRIVVGYSPTLAKWSVKDGYTPRAKFSAEGISLGDILECILNNKPVNVYTGRGETRELSQKLTDAANIVADDIRNDFREWLWSDRERTKRLTRYYNDNYNSTVERQYDGSHLTFPGMNPAIKLDKHQKDVVWRTLQKGNTLIAHCVGAGKTFSMQAAGMEMRRLGIARKPLYALPNNVVEQFVREFRQLYPNAKILKLTNADLPEIEGKGKQKTKAQILKDRETRTKTLTRIQTEDWDVIVVSHTLFERLPVSPETAKEHIEEELKTLELAIEEQNPGVFGKRQLSILVQRKRSLEEKLKQQLNTDTKNIGITFEQLGIDQLFVDEADMFKNLQFTTSMDRIAGITNPQKVNRASDMFMKTQWLTNRMGGRGVVFATGTPISNTMAEMFTMMRYMDMKGLKEKGLHLFDRWCATFAEIGSGIERKPTGDGFRKVNKVKRFINMADLTKMFRTFADVKTQADLNLDIPELKNGKPTIVAINSDPKLTDYIKNVVPKRVANMKKGFNKQKGEDNMLALTNDLRKMSINDDKIEACADMIAAKFEETNDIKGAQLVFCDIGIPKAEKDKTSDNEDDGVDNDGEAENEAVYTKLMKALRDRGIPENQIGFIQSAKSKEKADEMFQKVDSGELRILIGSTQRMGAGTNCQHHLVALHDLDAPWRPRDLEQRHGRILRRGNPNKEVEIFNYVVKGSFDANMWEKLKNKAAIIAQAMSGDTGIRAMEDADLVALGYAELEGAATDNPLIRERLELNNKVTRYTNAQTVFEKKQEKAVKIVDEYPMQIGALKELVGRIKKDIADRTDIKGDKFKAVIGGKTYTERAKADEALQKILAVFTKKVSTEIGEIGGLKIHALYEEKKYTVGGNTEKETDGNIHLTLVGNRAYPVNTATIRGIEGTLQTKPEQMLKDTESDLKNKEDELEGAKEIVGKEYPHKEELKEMQDRLTEIDRRIEEELVERGRDEKKQDSKYSITDRADIAGEMTAEQFESEVRKAFPTAENFKNDGSEISFTLPNGSSVTVNLTDHIAMSVDKAGRDYGRNISDNEVAEGSYGGAGRDGFIELAKGGRVGTIFHEAYHFAKATALNAKEKAFLSKRYKNEEEEAEAYRKWRLAKDRTGMFGKIWRKVQEVAEKMAGVLGIETKGRIFRSIESGEVYNRTANEQTDFEKKYSILTNDNSNEGFAQRIKNRFAGVLSHKKETENYRQTAMELLGNLTQCKIAWGKLDPELGAVYKKLCGVIRVAKPYDFARLMPAVGEAIAERLELNPTGEMSHYIADWIMTGALNNETAEAKEFARAMKANAYMSDKLLEVQGLFMKHFDEMSQDFHQKMISFRKPSKDKGVKDWFKDFTEKLYTDCVEELYPVDKLIKQIEAKTGEKFHEINNPYIQYRMYRGWYGLAETLVEGNGKGDMEALQQLYPNVSFEGFKSLKTILQQVGAVKDRAAQEAFSEYCVAMHVRDIHKHNLDIENEIAENAEKIGKLKREDGSKAKIQKLKKKNQQLEDEWMETPYTADECEKIIGESREKYPAFEKGQKDLVKYSNRLVAILYDSGMISVKQANDIVGKWKNYVPMFREFEESEEIEFGDSMKAQTGSKRKVIDPLQSIIRNTYTTVQKSERNRCRQSLANVCRCSDVGEYIEFVDEKGSPDMNDTVVVYYKGKRKYLVTDPSVARAVNGLDRVNQNTLLQILQWPVKFARLCFVTINPAFAVRNVIRDGADAAIYSKYGFNPKDFVYGLIHSIAKDDMYWKWIAAGGGQSSRLSLDRDYTQSAIDRLTMNHSGNRIARKLRRIHDTLAMAGEYSEYATRIGVFEKNLRNFQTKEGRMARDSIISAAFMSRDLIDFARGGRYSRGLNKVSLFANASIQGWDKFFRTFDPRDRKSFMRAVARLTFTAMIPALTIALMFRGDDWWEELPDWMKETNWCFKLGDTIIRIPKGQDVATRFFSNGIEKMISKKGKMNADLLDPLYDALPSLVPFGLVPIAEVATNHSFFTKGKVVPGYLERLPGDKQYNSSTSVLAKYLGEKTGYSPIKIDHLITSYAGNVGRGAGEFLNWIGRDKHSMPNITDLPMVNGVTYMPYKNPASVTKFYEDWDKVQKEHTLYKQTGQARDGYSESEYEKMSKVNKALTELSRKERAVVEDTRLSNSDRYDKQMAIQKQRMNIVHSLK